MFYKSSLILLLSIIIKTSAFAEEGIDPFASSSFASTEGIISSIVAGHVSAISGDLLIHEEDSALPGPNPLRLQRNYCSGDPYGVFIHKSWHLVEPTFLLYGHTKRKGTAYALLTTPHGARAFFETSLKGKPQGRTLFSFISVKGYTNCGSGNISGQTNIRNNVLHLNNDNFSGDLISGDGTKQLYSQLYEADLTSSMAGYYMYQEINPNRTAKHFFYKPGKLSLIQQTSWNAAISYGKFTFNWLSGHKLEIQPSTGNKEKTITYHFEKKEWKNKKKSYYLNKVENPEKPPVEYIYQKAKRHTNHRIISEKILPEGRGFKVVYYDSGDETKDRVKELLAPIGKNGAFQATYRFQYAFNYPGGVFNNGATHVYDAYDRKTTYDYDKEERLNQIVHYNRSGALHSLETYFFEGKGEPQEGNLIARYLKDSSHCPIKGKTFLYDDKGNVTHSKTYATITGKNNLPIIIGEDARPIDNGTEYYGKTFQYGENNLVLSEKEDSGKEIRYTYQCNAISSKLLVNAQNEILVREFYDYDDNLFLTRKIVDDGNTQDRDKLSGVSYRKITHYTPQTIEPFGLPEEVVENYLDLETEQEIRLKRSLNHYTIEGRIKQQDHFDCYNNRCYTLSWEYDAHGNITKEINAAGEVTLRDYDANDNLIYEKNLAQGIERIYTYDFVNRPTRTEEKHPDGISFIEETSYDLVGNITSKKDLIGNVTNYTYNDQNRLILIQYPEVMCEGILVRPQESFDYDILGNKIWQQDRLGFITVTACNANGSPLHINYPDGTSEHFEYYPNGDLEKTIHKNGSYTIYIRDCLGRTTSEQEFSQQGTLLSQKTFIFKGTLLITETDPEGTTTHYTYDGAGRLIKKQIAEKKTTFTYDHLGRIGSQTDWISDAESRTTSYTYNIKGLVTNETITDSSGNQFFITKNSYNVFGQKTMIRMGKAIESFDYNSRQELIKKTDAKRNVTKYYYDYKYTPPNAGWVGSKTTIVDPLGNTTTSIEDSLGRTIETSIWRLNKHLSSIEYSYDLQDNLIKVDEAKIIDGAVVSEFTREWAYNSVHDVIFMKEASQTPEERTTTYYYNSFGQKTSVEKPDGVILYSSYDEKGRLLEYYSSDNTIFYHYAYDKNDRVSEVQDLINNQTTYLSYDSHGRLIEETLGNGMTILSSYDPLDRKLSLHVLNQSVDYQYDPSFLREIRYGEITCRRETYDEYGNLLQSVLPNRCGKLTHTYDSLQRRLTTEHPCFSHTIHKTWGFDKVGNILKDKIQGQERKFSYDKLYHLASEDGFEKHAYSYDSLSNRILKNGTPCTVNPLNHLLSQEGAVYTYDLNGNRIKKEESGRITAYTYDALNRMIEVKTPDKIVQYTYDPFDRRLLKKTGGIEEHYLYDGQNEIGMVQNGKLQQLRILDPNYSSEQGAAIFLKLADDAYIPLHDIYGNVAVLLNGDGMQSKTYHYTAFGIELNNPCNINPWRYASKRLDPETGLIYFGRRYYDPKIARWTSPDPAEYADGPNLYAYLHNNPLYRFDRHGLWGDDFWSDSWDVCKGVGHAYSSYRQAEAGFYIGAASCFYNLGVGVAHSAWNSAHWLGADFEHEYGDPSLFNSRLKSLEGGCHEFRTAFNESPYSTIGELAVPGIMEVSRLSSSNTPYEIGSAFGKAGVDAVLTASLVGSGIKAIGAMGRAALFDVRAGTVASKVAQSVESCAKGVVALSSGAENVNAGVNLNSKLSQLQTFQQTNSHTRILHDGRIRYYGKETLSTKNGPTRGGARVLEFNPKTASTRSWYECYDHSGSINRIHPKQINGQDVISPHYPPTGRELGY